MDRPPRRPLHPRAHPTHRLLLSGALAALSLAAPARAQEPDPVPSRPGPVAAALAERLKEPSDPGAAAQPLPTAAAPHGKKDEQPEDLTQLSLEELMQISITTINVLGS